MPINILDFKVANMIAAGEVVDRPASVVKELLENSIDAGALEIETEIRRGGVAYIRVTDNGSGMTKDDAELCILRHATSKIKDEKDLERIVTLGFRGEALAAISSVSQMSIRTRTANDSVGAYIECDCGRITEVGETGCKKGTTMVVRELFANVPARRKFLKRDQSEGMAVAAVVEKAALSHPEISFRLISDGSLRIQTAGDRKLYNAIYALLGREFAGKLIEVRGKSEAVEVIGYIGRPDNVRANRNYQNFFINGRYVKSRTATAALEQAYSSFMESEKFPCCVLNVFIHPALVDVNVHPTKLEVKFSSEKTVFDAIYLSCRNALLSDTARPQMQIEKKDINHKAIGTYNRFVPIYDRMEGHPLEQTEMTEGLEGSGPTEGSKEKERKSVPQIPFDDLPFIFGDIAKAADKAAEDREKADQEEKRDKGNKTDQAGIAAEAAEKVGGERSKDGQSPESRENPQSLKELKYAENAENAESAGNPEKEEFFGTGNEGHTGEWRKMNPASDEELFSGPPGEPACGLIASASSPGFPTGGGREVSEKSGHSNDGRAGEDFKRSFKENFSEKSAEKFGTDALKRFGEPEFKLLGVAFETYILVEIGDKLMMIDKHAAHERLIFERMKENMRSSDDRYVQLLLLPETVHVGRAEKSAALEYEKELTEAGFIFSFEDYEDAVSVVGIPGALEKEQALTLFSEMIAGLASGEGDAEVSRQAAFEKRLYSASCKAAMKGSRHDGEEHIEYLVKELLRLPDIRYCPHGRPVAFEIPKGSIEHRFKRS